MTDQRARARPLGRRVEIMVLDDAPSLPAEMLETITGPFERGEASRNWRTGGADLGLSIVQTQAKGQGSRLTLANRPECELAAAIDLPTHPPS